MIQAIELEDFKGIAARQRIDFALVSVLFGANTAGKSTILKALLYLHEVLERGSADVDRTELSRDVLELGRFARLVHRHELTAPSCFGPSSPRQVGLGATVVTSPTFRFPTSPPPQGDYPARPSASAPVHAPSRPNRGNT